METLLDLYASLGREVSDSGAVCVECGIVSPTTVAVRDSKHPQGPALLFSAAALSAFVEGVVAS
ncbi:DUF397 domain-containing protein [Streptomyces koyangensis]|uniref:DUF397 domain-containing protein n=1 Tax=Streptomyces koyangensis TaxID=188770 RepID=A0ABX7EN17_9ACTN|nr:DUF397 domain-containing protein [Streptomyces koyangensis]QRF06284.1 DUF397 domain-containing protein [Streptomyces koyangensis]